MFLPGVRAPGEQEVGGGNGEDAQQPGRQLGLYTAPLSTRRMNIQISSQRNRTKVGLTKKAVAHCGRVIK